MPSQPDIFPYADINHYSNTQHWRKTNHSFKMMMILTMTMQRPYQKFLDFFFWFLDQALKCMNVRKNIWKF